MDLDRAARGHQALRLLVLFGSRAIGSAHDGSDWDLGYLADPGLDVEALLADLVAALGTDDVDLVDLSAASAVLRRDAGAQGRPVLEREPGAFLDFAVDAAIAWCDLEPVLRAAHADVLRALAG